MMSDKSALLNFTSRWLAQFDDAPESESLHAIPSPCIVASKKEKTALTVSWKPVLMEPIKNLTIVEQVINIQLHPSAHIFYGTQYAGDISAIFNDGQGVVLPVTLVQIWNDVEFSQLEQNLIAHLTMQKKLKRLPTVFIATTDDNSEIISINNLSGEVVRESLITGEQQRLAADLSTFFAQLD